MRLKYTKELLEPLVKESVTIVEVLDKLGIKKRNGGNHNYISKRIKHFDIDTTHFVGQSWNKGKGKDRVGGHKYREPKDILVIKSEDSYREKAKVLRRALKEIGVPYKCCISDCKIKSWLGKEIKLEVDHINGNPLDNRVENLRLICPNCHSQTPNFRNYKKT